MAHRVERPSVRPPLAHQVARRQPQQRPPQRLHQGRLLDPIRIGQDGLETAFRSQAAVRQAGQRPVFGLGQHAPLALGQPLVQPGAEAGDGRQGGEGLQADEFPRQVVHHPLDQEIAEADAGEPFLGVGDGVEDGGVGLGRVAHRRGGVEQFLHIAGDAAHQRHLDEDQRLVRHAGVEEAVKAPVGIQPILEVVPALDGMDRLVDHDLFQHGGGRAPGDALQFQEADIEPGGQQALEVALQRRQRRVALDLIYKLGPHVHQELDTFRQRIESGQQFQARRFKCLSKSTLGLGAVVAVGGVQVLDGGVDLVAFGAEFLGQQAQEARPPLGVEGEIGAAQRRGTCAGGDLAAAALQAGLHLPPQRPEIALGQVGGQHHLVAAAPGDAAP